MGFGGLRGGQTRGFAGIRLVVGGFALIGCTGETPALLDSTEPIHNPSRPLVDPRLFVPSPTAQTQAGFGQRVADIGDVDGDGQADLAINSWGEVVNFAGGSYTGRVTIASGRDGARLFTLDSPEPQPQAPDLYFGHSLRSPGDLDGDGRPEIAVGSRRFDDGTNVDQGRVYVFRGVDGSFLHAISDGIPQFSAWFGDRMELVGDLDGGGMSDLAVSRTASESVELVSTERGAPLRTVVNPTPATTSFFGWAIAALGDLDGDGLGDLAVSAPWNAGTKNGVSVPGAGQVFVFSSTGETLAVLENSCGCGGSFGYGLASVSDLDGDSVRDLAIMAGGGRVIVVAMGAARRGTPILTLEWRSELAGFFGENITSIPDMNCDGVGDIAVASRGGCDEWDGAVLLYSGRDGTSLGDIRPILSGPGRFGVSMTVLGEKQADGSVDLAVGASGANAGYTTEQGVVFVYRISPAPVCSGTGGSTPPGEGVVATP
jgi:hypothetical protein